MSSKTDGFLIRAYTMGPSSIHAASYAEACRKGFYMVKSAEEELTYQSFLRRFNILNDPAPGEDFGRPILVQGKDAFMTARRGNQVLYVRKGETSILSSHELDVEFPLDEGPSDPGEHDIVVEVTLSGDLGFEDLDPEDLDENGECTVDGAYLLTVVPDRVMSADEAAQLALDGFSERAGISCPEDYMITARPRNMYDTESMFRSDLGRVHLPSEPEEDAGPEI